MKILLTGAAGQLGRELKRSLACLGEVVACDRSQLDLSKPETLRDAVRAIAPDVIVNAAAYTAVDKAEAAYGRSKRDGELAIAAAGARHLIFRTSWVYGLHGANFMKTMLRLGRRSCETGDELRVVGDQTGAPTWTRHLADATALILARKDIPNGLYHLAAAGATSWHGYAEAIFAAARAAGLMEKLPVVRRIASADYPLPAPRPANSRLDCSRFQRDCGLALPDWHTGLIDCLADARF
jgi:dTDP-4-dehydrorhamnose reductase